MNFATAKALTEKEYKSISNLYDDDEDFILVSPVGKVLTYGTFGDCLVKQRTQQDTEILFIDGSDILDY